MESTERKKTKSQSQKLRACLYIYWKQKGEKGDFELFYQKMMDKFITFVKGKLSN